MKYALAHLRNGFKILSQPHTLMNKVEQKLRKENQKHNNTIAFFMQQQQRKN